MDEALALKELYRPVPVREGDKLIKMPPIQAVLRSKVALAAKGNGPAQRALIEIARALEKEHAAEMASKGGRAKRPISDLEAVLAFDIAGFLQTLAESGDHMLGGINR
jgi:hypothetical protein